TLSRSKETFASTDPPPRLEALGSGADVAGGIVYPEWDFESGRYQANAVRVRLASALEGSGAWVEQTLARHAGVLREIKRRLGAIRPDRQVLKGRLEGEEVDWDALVAERGERRAGGTPAGACYQSRSPAPRRIGLLLLVDASASTDAWVAGKVRVIDVEKEAALIAASALDAAKMEFAVLAFSGEGPRGVQLWEIKGFDEAWDRTRQRRVAGLEPDRYTRLGAALRHAAQVLARRATEHRLLLLFSDGWPNDYDRYTSRYGIEDARQSVIEARRRHIAPYCFTVDREGGGYLPTIFGAGRYTIVQQPQQLPMAFIAWLRHVARQCRSR
ncbi:MAG TPA: VWA domain-containing protein, partial [Azonexus sp.]|nr:VWA domain-containing protein [Azonexus sp.]